MRGHAVTRALAAALLGLALATSAMAAEPKVLRIAFNTAETEFDPAHISDIYSRAVAAHIFEALYDYDPLARPAKIRPLTAAAMPEVSPDFRSWTIRLTPGIRFADDPAFGGRPRELVAADYVYSFKRLADPRHKSPMWSELESMGVLGLAELRQAALRDKQPFNYEREIEGLRALDRHTLQIRLAAPRPRLVETLAKSDQLGAVAREVVEQHGDASGQHPVGTGPFRLKQWRRSSLIVLERNPGYRAVHYDAEPAPDDAQGQAILARLKDRRLPLVDEVHVSIIDEDQPLWLAFLNGQLDASAGITSPVPPHFVPSAMPNGKLAPHLAKRGIQAQQQLNPDISFMYFNMEHPVVGGYTPDKVALRRAIALAIDTESEIRLIRHGNAVPAQSVVTPHTRGYDPQFKSENGDHDPARAKALLDLYGYVDRDGDGWRELPDGAPLLLEYTTQPEQIYRRFNELTRKDMDTIGVRVRFITGQWPENLRQARAGKLMLWSLGYTAAMPDGQNLLQRLHGPEAGAQNLARFRLPAFDAVYDRMAMLPNGPERDALFVQAKQIAVAYMPYKVITHRIGTDLLHPWVIGFRRPLFWHAWWHTVDVDTAARAQARR